MMETTLALSQANITVGLNKREALPSAQVWLCLQNNNNEYYLSLADGSSNYNSKNSKINVLLVESIDFVDYVFDSEEDCWSNKHSSWDAAKYHYHLGKRIFVFIRSLQNGTYEIWRSICFIVLLPKPREVFAAHYQDRIAHHIAAPYIKAVAEAVHIANGNVSFGNRSGMSSYHACLRVQEMMKKHINGYVAVFDIKGCFMSMKKETAWKIFCEYEEKYRPSGYSEEFRQFIMGLIYKMIMHNPAENCERHSPQELWELIPNEKSLFFMDGLPIGNFYSQLIMNLSLEIIIEYILEYDPTEFVDDFSAFLDNPKDFKKLVGKMRYAANKIGLQLNFKKIHIQPVRHGVLWCGHFIYPNRMYASNRVIGNCLWQIDYVYSEVNLLNARRLVQTLNSYSGFLCHCNEWNTQMRIFDKVMSTEYRQYIEAHFKQNHIVYDMRRKYRRKQMSLNDIAELDNMFNRKYKEAV